ncbi:isoprenyl transferase [Anaerotignum propionicum]|uniref:isoprenyl transferase n=1 Tax=Anaerotignum propionicum TaxID=28446 RepID=UPI00210941B0|nr:isoprenyl transferase [Anaerotignum propionicum]MCQ4936585.1 isoprenyl transferase [Anaerotignum propionicum]
MFFQKKEKAVSIDMTRLPKHIAIIMDGNGRWAAKRALPRKAGHKAGAEAFERLITEAKDIGIQHITVYAFSTENWKRSDEEVNAIMDLMRHYLKNSFQRFLKDNVRMHIIGDISRLDKDIQEQIQEVEEKSKEKDGMTVHIALNYGGRDELLRSVQKITEKALNGQIYLQDITEETIEENLDTAGVPDPELLIRTSGEERISNFLLWQIAYSELYFSNVLWPDFNKKDLVEAIYYYQNRERRFGGR